jgi:hypothetical protein
MKSLTRLALATSALTSIATSLTVSLSPAATTVTASVSSAPSLFPGETIQLTNEILTDVATVLQDVDISGLFSFDLNLTFSERNARPCKLLPGDSLWPDTRIWDIFDLLLGGRLIKAVPLAAVCYPAWPEYNATSCAAITAEWLTSNLQ